MFEILKTFAPLHCFIIFFFAPNSLNTLEKILQRTLRLLNHHLSERSSDHQKVTFLSLPLIFCCILIGLHHPLTVWCIRCGMFSLFCFSFSAFRVSRPFLCEPPPCSSISFSSVESLCLRTLISSLFVFLQLLRWLAPKLHPTLLHLLATLRRTPVGQTPPPPATPQGTLTSL